MAKNKAFTLAEILVALGILAIGMSMVASVFMAAMQFNMRSRNSVLGRIICENAMVVADLALVQEALTSETLEVYADVNHSYSKANDSCVTLEQQRYPTGLERSREGFAVLARRVDLTLYQVVVVAYRKSDKANAVKLIKISCNISGDEISGDNLRIGTPLINAATGAIGLVESVSLSGKNGKLKPLPGQSFASGEYYVLVECTPGGAVVAADDVRRSPAIGSMMRRMLLRKAPVVEGDEE